MESHSVEVWIENGVVKKRPFDGDFTVTGPGEATIVFEPRPGETGWIFKDINVEAQPGHTQGGEFFKDVHEDKIYLTDVVTGNGRSRYTITLERDGKPLSDDPEIENIHKPGPATVSGGVSTRIA